MYMYICIYIYYVYIYIYMYIHTHGTIDCYIGGFLRIPSHHGFQDQIMVIRDSDDLGNVSPIFRTRPYACYIQQK